jgi:hypothetical protein
VLIDEDAISHHRVRAALSLNPRIPGSGLTLPKGLGDDTLSNLDLLIFE